MSTYPACLGCGKVVLENPSAWQREHGDICRCHTMPRNAPQCHGETPQGETRGNKYGAVKTTVDGQVFDSKKEARRYEELCLLQKAGEITDLECQPRYDFVVNGIKVAHYTGDFRYRREGTIIVEDTKSEMTRKIRDYPIRVKLLRALYGIEVTEV